MWIMKKFRFDRINTGTSQGAQNGRTAGQEKAPPSGPPRQANYPRSACRPPRRDPASDQRNAEAPRPAGASDDLSGGLDGSKCPGGRTARGWRVWAVRSHPNRARRAVIQLDPVDEFNALKPNSKAHAVYWLRTGELHPEAHHIIVARLTPWIERVTAAGAEILDKLRALVLAEQGAG